VNVLLFAPKFNAVCVLSVSVAPPIFTNRTAPVMFPENVAAELPCNVNVAGAPVFVTTPCDPPNAPTTDDVPAKSNTATSFNANVPVAGPATRCPNRNVPAFTANVP
jgi:hypothetical protein